MNRIVVKIGSSSIVNPETSSIHQARMLSLAADVAWLRKEFKTEVIVMSSGALAWGRERIRASQITNHHEDIEQIAGACGQIGIAAAWEDAFRHQSLAIGQLLLTPADVNTEIVRQTIEQMLLSGIIPYINENIPVMAQYDNDALAAEIAKHLSCDTLMLLSDVDGVYSDNPKTNPDAQLIEQINNIDEALLRFGGGTSTSLGTGGMITKLQAAKTLSSLGVNTIIASGECLNPIRKIIEGNQGTRITGAALPH